MIRLSQTALLFAICFASSASSEPISVRSGEHDQFTRLVMLLPNETTWDLEKEVETAWIELNGFDEGFDLSGAFEIIPRTRLNALVATNNRLELQMNCDCIVTGFLEQNGYLVIDIADDVSNEENGETSPLVEMIADVEDVQPTRLDLPESSFQFGDLLWSDEGEETDTSLNETKVIQKQPSDLAAEPVSRAAQERIETTRQNILEAFSAAASRGLVEVTENTPDPKGDVEPENQTAEIFDTSQRVTEVVKDKGTNIRITTSADVPTESPDQQVALSGASCPNPGLLKISSWASEKSFDDQIGESNRNLFDDAGRLNEEEALSRAKLYIHFGFGAEARQFLEMIPDISIQYPELFDLSQYFEHGFVKNPRILHRFPDCDSEFALWGMLSPEVFPSTTPANIDAALLALETLPDHLKYFVGQDLGDTLLRHGDLEQGAIAMRSYERLPQHKGGTVTVNNANAERLRENNQESQKKLFEVVTNHTTESPVALIQLIDQRLEENGSISEELMQLAEAYSFELRGTELEPLMLKALILAHAQASLFDSSIDKFDVHSGVFDLEQKRDVISRVFTSIAVTATDSEFLKRYFFDFGRLSSMVNDEVKLSVGERMFALGFEDEAKAVIRGLEAQFQSERFKVLSAKINMNEGMFNEALDSLNGVRTPDANSIRALALFGLGQNSEARELFYLADEPGLATSATWLSDEWTDLVSDEDPVFGPVRAVALQNVPIVNRDSDIVNQALSVLEESAQARETLQVFLNDLQLSN